MHVRLKKELFVIVHETPEGFPEGVPKSMEAFERGPFWHLLGRARHKLLTGLRPAQVKGQSNLAFLPALPAPANFLSIICQIRNSQVSCFSFLTQMNYKVL